MLQIKTYIILFTALMAVLPLSSVADTSSVSVGWLLGEARDEDYAPLFEADIVGPQEVRSALELYRSGDFRGAAGILENVQRLVLPDGALDFTDFALGECYRMLGLRQKALDNYYSVMTRFPSSKMVAASYYRVLQYAYLDRDGNKADSLFSILQQRFRSHPIYNSVLFEMGKLYFREGRYAEGYQLLTQIPRNSGWHVQSQFLASLCYVELKEWEKALFLLQYVSKEAKSDTIKDEASIVIGDIYYVRGNLEAALQFYKGVSEKSIRYQYAQVKSARVCLDLKRYTQAGEMSRAYLSKHPDSEYYFEMASILEQAYNGLGDKDNAARINYRIFQQLSNARLSFEIYDELDSISSMLRTWEYLDFRGLRTGDAVLRTEVRSNIDRLKGLDKAHRRLLSSLGVRQGREAQGMPAGMAERRYLAMVKDSMGILDDSIKTVRARHTAMAATAKDSVAEGARQKLRLRLDTLATLYDRYSHEHDLVVNECMGNRAGDQRFSEEELQAQFVDWAFTKYLDHKKELAQSTAKAPAGKKAEKGTADIKKNEGAGKSGDTLSDKGRQVVQVFGDIERQRRQEALLDERTRIMTHINSLLDIYPKSKYNPQLLFRLAELHYDQASDDFAVKLAAFEKHMATAGKNDTTSFPEYSLEPVLRLYDRIITGYPKDMLAGAAMFYKGLALKKLGRDADANIVFVALTQKYPESEYYVEANMNIGKYFFDHPTLQNNTGYAQAEEAFRKVLYYRDHPEFVQALYHLGWCYYMQDQYEEAIAVFKYLVEEVDLDFSPGKMEENQVVNPLLRAEAIDYIAISFDENGSTDQAIEFLKLIGNTDYASLVLKRIGELREEDLDYKAAVVVYNRLIQEYPLSVAAPDAAVNLIKLYETMSIPDSALAERERFFSRFSGGSPWQDPALKRDSATVMHIDSMSIAIGMYVGDAHFRAAEQKRDQNEYQKAADSYNAVVSTYPNSARAIEALWNLAAILDTKLGKRTAAYDRYILYSRFDNAPLDKREQAALNAIAIAQQLLPPEDTTVAAGTMELPAVKLIEAVDNYTALFPKGSSRGTVMLTEGSLFFNRKMYGNAAKVFEEIVALGPETKEFYPAQFLLGQCHYGDKNWMAAAKQFGVVWKGSPDPVQRTDAYKLLLQCEFFNAQQLAKAGDLEKAAAAYLSIEEKYPGSEYGDIVLFNAAQTYEKKEQWERSAETYLLLFKKYPGSKYTPIALFNSANSFEKIEKYPRTAETYELLVSQYPRSDQSKDALFNLGLVYEKMGKPEKMAEVNERYAQMYPGEKDVEAMLLRSGNYYFKTAMYDRARNVYKNFIARFARNPRIVECYVMLGRIAQESKDEENALVSYSEAEKANQRLSQAGLEANNYFAGEASYHRGNIYRKRCADVKLVLPVKVLKEREKQKSELLAEAVRSYQRVLQYQSERMFEAAFLIGQLYDDLAIAWYEQEREKLDPIKAAVFERDLNVVTSSLLQKTFIPYRKGLEIAKGFDSLTSEQKVWVGRTRENIASAYYRAGQHLLDAALAMNKAPVPKEILDQPVYFFQYQKQLVETIEPMMLQSRDFYVTACTELAALGFTGKELELCQIEFNRVNYLAGGQWDNLATQIIKSTSNLPKDLTAEQKEEVVFQLEDIVFEVQDKAIPALEEARDIALKGNLQDKTWFSKILESLARLAPETYGKAFFQTVSASSGDDWIVRADSVTGWAGTQIPAEGWRGAAVVESPGTAVFTTGKPSVIWDQQEQTPRAYFWKHVFLNGSPRGAAIHIAAAGKYRLYVNGALTLSDTVGNRTLGKRDSASGIQSLIKGGDNVIACESWSKDGSAGVAVVLSVMIDTSQHFESTIKVPKVALAKKKELVVEKAPQPASVPATTAPSAEKPSASTSTPPKQPVSGSASAAVQKPSRAPAVSSGSASAPAIDTKGYKSSDEVQKAILDYQTKEGVLVKDIRRERLEIQKMTVMRNAMELQIRMVKDEIKSIKTKMDTLGEKK